MRILGVAEVTRSLASDRCRKCPNLRCLSFRCSFSFPFRHSPTWVFANLVRSTMDLIWSLNAVMISHPLRVRKGGGEKKLKIFLACFLRAARKGFHWKAGGQDTQDHQDTQDVAGPRVEGRGALGSGSQVANAERGPVARGWLG